jgi:hypothetical protein
MRPSKGYAMRSYLEQINVSNRINSVQSCDDKVSMLETIVKIGLDFIMPLQTRTVISNEPSVDHFLFERPYRKTTKSFE